MTSVEAADRLAERAGAHLDLVSAPFTLPGSRLLVLRDAHEHDALTVRMAEYERPLDECVVIGCLRVLDGAGERLAPTRVLPDRIEFGDGAVTLVFASASTLSLGARDASAAWMLELAGLAGLEPDRARWHPRLPSAPDASWRTDGGGAVVTGDESVRFAGCGGIMLTAGGAAAGRSHGEHRRHAAEVWRDWFARCPRVRHDLQDMAAFCWWVLGANIVTLPGQGDARAVVPSKIGYVGLWQWDAYFIAVGLRHGAPELAREQLELALRRATPEGQLPDVVHDGGVLASSDDLPPADREHLRAAGSSVADPAVPVPLTKPPLTAWALRKVLEVVEPGEWSDAAWRTIARSQEWWFDNSDADGDGLPEYGHPYSSGLDDSPIFDGALPVASPDLAAYLILQDDELARHSAALGDDAAAARYSARADRTLALLEGMWDPSGGCFRAGGAGAQERGDTVVGLLPLVTGRLPERIVEALTATLANPRRFATPFPVPTVAADDRSFSPGRMWRGPVWINTNALLVDGLLASGRPVLARRLAEQTVDLVIHAGGPHEFFDPFSGSKAPAATTVFGWSAALFLDLSVALSN